MSALKRGSSSLLRWHAQEWPGASSMNSDAARAQCSRALDWCKPIGPRSLVMVQAGLCALTFSVALTTVPTRRSTFSKSNHSIVVVIAETPLCAGTHNRGFHFDVAAELAAAFQHAVCILELVAVAEFKRDMSSTSCSIRSAAFIAALNSRRCTVPPATRRDSAGT